MPYRSGPKVCESQKYDVARMPKLDFIILAKTKSASQIYLAPKKNGTLRGFMGCRKPKAATVRDSYLIQGIDEGTDLLRDTTTFVTLETNSGHQQVEIADQDTEKIVFARHQGLFKFICMLSGFKNAPGAFQRAMDVMTWTVQRQFARV